MSTHPEKVFFSQLQGNITFALPVFFFSKRKFKSFNTAPEQDVMHQEACFPHIWNIKDCIEKDADEKSSMLKDLVMVQTMW